MIPTEDGIYQGISDIEYHGDKASLSSSGARLILEPGGPAKFRWAQDRPSEPSDVFDLGHAVHTAILGVGGEYADAGFDAWTTKAAKEARDDLRAAGQIPLKSSDYTRVTAMTEAVLNHELGELLFAEGDAELSIYYHDDRTGERLRARPDWLRRADRPMIVDLKTTVSANPVEFGRKSVPTYGYHQQDPWYRDAVATAGLGDDPQFVFVLVEKTPPYLVSVVELVPDAIADGRMLNRAAIDMYADCRDRNVWPGYPSLIHPVDVPDWSHGATDRLLRNLESA